jgi:hypothetical protein
MGYCMMNKTLLILLSTMFILAMGAGNAFAAYDHIQQNGEPYLESILNNSYGVGTYHEITNTNNYEFVPGSYFTTVIEAHEAAYTNPTGWYGVGNPSVLNQLYSNPENQKNVIQNVANSGNFGLYITSGDGNTYYSNSSLNPDRSVSPQNGKHVRCFMIDSGSDKGAYVLGFEDKNTAGVSDWDYQDVVVELKGANLSIPEFPTVALPVAGVLGILFVFGRKKGDL